jgi:hypothetical protein
VLNFEMLVGGFIRWGLSGVLALGRWLAMGATAGAATVADAQVHLPPTYMLRRSHVLDALKGVPDDVRNVTVFIHSSTLGIEKKCFHGMKRVSRILVSGPEPPAVKAATLGVIIAKLRAYEPDLVDDIRRLVPHKGDDEAHRVGEQAFYGCTSLREVVLPYSITHLGKNAFKRCTSLTLVTLPDSLTDVEYGAFWGCKSLVSVTLPDALTNVGYCTFSWCTSLTTVLLPKSVIHVGHNAFQGCTSLKLVTLPDSPTYIGDYEFPKDIIRRRSSAESSRGRKSKSSCVIA